MQRLNRMPCLLLIGLAISWVLTPYPAAASENAKRPNVLFIAIDDLRPELGCYGDTVVKSPNIDKLASQGILFNRAYCQVAVCGASRASMMTGILPTRTRFTEAKSRADQDAPGAKTLAQVFREAGYTSLAHGKIFHQSGDTADRSWSRPVTSPGMSHMIHVDPATVNVPSDRGRGLFYECVDTPDNTYPDGVVAENAIADLRKLKQSGEPFFLACGFIRPHLPFYAPKKYWDLYDESSLPLARNRFRPKDAPKALRGFREYAAYAMGDYQAKSEAFHRKMRHGYFAATSYSDKLAGAVLNELESLGLADNTIVVVWGDHGWHLGEHDFWGKHNTLHNAVRIPLIVKVPGKTSGQQTNSLVAGIDIFPTLCKLAGIEVPQSVQGKSLQTLLKNPEDQINDVIYTRFREADAVVTDRLTYSRFENGEEMLYDLEMDPQENENVANSPEYAQQLRSMQAKLSEQMKLADEASF
ncbi:Arylsulfatase [Rubripirellula obstinata]|uniref:Arylsulfatase n=1 Tax=Rubripirellula obstinata TaxID=406547 RepID=A0A5B1CHV2_9BACT|nr:sulfatase [Rubripirellula obstinata]KAA1259073.1 Arylsulfatase [Rubripirellula obstinata]